MYFEAHHDDGARRHVEALRFANPNGQLGNAAVGIISAMLSSPSCHTCGTVERQIQLAMTLKF